MSVLPSSPQVVAGALADIKVVDLSQRLSAAYCAKLLGDHGADVVLLETESGHPLRHEPPFLGDIEGAERSLVHAYVNANKVSVVLPSEDPAQADLIAHADVIVVSDRATADRVRPIARPDVILVGVSPYGLDTPVTDAPGTDLTTSAITGWALINGDEGAPPLRPTLHQSEYMAGLMAYTGTVSALFARDQTGKGETVDVCELEPMLWMAAPNILGASHGDGFSPGRSHPGVFKGPVPTRDGYFSVTFSRPHFWTEAMRALGLDDLADDPRYLDRQVRQAEGPELEARIEEAIAARDRWDLFDDLSRRRCTVGVVLDVSDLATSEQLTGRGVIGATEVEGQSVATLASPCHMSSSPWVQRRPAPRLGEHTIRVLADWLGREEESR